MLVVLPNTPHGFRNISDVPLLTVSIHESGGLDQTFLGASGLTLDAALAARPTRGNASGTRRFAPVRFSP